MSKLPEGVPELLPCYLKEVFDYREGQLLYKKSYRNRRTGQKAGTVDSKGRLRIEIKGRTYSAAAIVFAMHFGRWPNGQTDHINQNKLDNRIENIREVTNAQNSRNRINQKPPKSGYKGVSFHRGRYTARIMVDGKVFNLGSFDDPISAAKIYNEAALKYHGEFACLSKI
jgi:hypothetical protein